MSSTTDLTTAVLASPFTINTLEIRNRIILGPMAEKALRQALQIAQGDLSVLFKSWISTVLIVLSIAAVVVPMILRARGRNLSQFATDTD